MSYTLTICLLIALFSALNTLEDHQETHQPQKQSPASSPALYSEDLEAVSGLEEPMDDMDKKNTLFRQERGSIDKRQSTRLETKCRIYKDYTYLRNRNTEKCWKWGDNFLNYTNAIRSCQEGALLVTIKTENEKKLLWRFFKDIVLWNGLDKINKPTFTWIDDNKPLKNFSYYYPDVKASQDLRKIPDCGTLENSTEDEFNFSCLPCFHTYSYICEIR
ncbi:antho-RFamide neuropeptides-like isoform X2 [Biomphalaria pfeifferi]|uniref:Antho-RFamide neuropeptides-like isoform X2 n=1 Tax=Biomphalaria pfeifferi TaxID=112525 RepID=A0AAD8BRL6_BIOPF|nr:antho-RFamide neuropeptides-like isoform X2 [Biomphalaria pfeifferi]